MDTDGPVEVASLKAGGQRGEQKMVGFIRNEMKRYGVKVAALQETKWCVGGGIVSISGREKPALGDSVQRGESVAIVLYGPVVDAWKRAEKQWKAWSSRVVSECLQMGEGSRCRLHVVSCYASTRVARREVKDAFFRSLTLCFASVRSGEKYVVLGDFKACVGSREHVGDH